MKLIKFSALILVIGRIKINPEFWEGQTVTIMDEYRGWETVYGPPPVSKSDWGYLHRNPARQAHSCLAHATSALTR